MFQSLTAPVLVLVVMAGYPPTSTTSSMSGSSSSSSFLVAAVSSSSSSSTANSYEQMCSIDPEWSRDFPVRRSVGHHRRRLGGDQRGRRLEASSVVFAGTLKDDGVEVVQRRLEKGEKNEEEEEESISSGDTPTMVPLYRCICRKQDYLDPRTTHSFCPMYYSCAIPFDGKPVECVDGRIMDGVARMAWPIFLSSVLCLLAIMVGSMYGIAVTKYSKKLWQRHGCGSFLCCCSCCPNAKMTQDDFDRLEQEEVDVLMEIARQQQQQSRSQRAEPSLLEAPPRYQIQRYQWYHYHTTILELARSGWRREWIDYCQSMAEQPVELRLPTKVFQGRPSRDVVTNEQGDRSNPMASTRIGTEEEGNGVHPTDGVGERAPGAGGATEDIVATVITEARTCPFKRHQDEEDDSCDDDVDDDQTCSICFAEIEIGQRIGDLPCGHDFHASCLKTWIGMSRRPPCCPLCQASNIVKVRRRGQPRPPRCQSRSQRNLEDLDGTSETTVMLDSTSSFDDPGNRSSFSSSGVPQHHVNDDDVDNNTDQ